MSRTTKNVSAMKTLLACSLLLMSLSLQACAGSSSDGGGGPNRVRNTTPPPAVVSVVVLPSTTQLTQGHTQQYTAVVKDAEGNVINGLDLTWSTGCPDVARIDPTGIALAVVEGITTVTATAGGITGPVATIVVPAAVMPSLLVGYVEASSENAWQGTYAVRLPDRTVTTGASQTTHIFEGVTLPIVTTGCELSSSCVAVNDFTMNAAVLFLGGTADLGSLGTVSWETQPVWVLPGDPSPPAAVLADVTGVLGGIHLTSPSSAFAFNGTLTAFFTSANGGQRLRAVRLDFAESPPPATSQTYRQGPVWIDNGVPVAAGTPLQPVVTGPPACSLAG